MTGHQKLAVSMNKVSMNKKVFLLAASQRLLHKEMEEKRTVAGNGFAR